MIYLNFNIITDSADHITIHSHFIIEESVAWREKNDFLKKFTSSQRISVKECRSPNC